MNNQVTTKEDKTASSSSSADKKQVFCSHESTLDEQQAKNVVYWTTFLEKSYRLKDGEIKSLSVFDSNLSSRINDILKKSYVSGIGDIFSIYPTNESSELLDMLTSYRKPAQNLNSDLDRISQDLWRSINASTERHIFKNTKLMRSKCIKAKNSQD